MRQLGGLDPMFVAHGSPNGSTTSPAQAQEQAPHGEPGHGGGHQLTGAAIADWIRWTSDHGWRARWPPGVGLPLRG